MSDNSSGTRRNVLKALGTTVITSNVAGQVSATTTDRVRVVEAGLRYEVPQVDGLETVHTDSRPPYTVQPDKGRVLLLKNASNRDRSRIRGSENLFDEKPVASQGKAEIAPAGDSVRTLPIALTSRMRPVEVVLLAKPLQFPSVTVQGQEETPLITTQSKGTTDLLPGERVTVGLPDQKAEVQTSRVVGDVMNDELPERLRGLKREEGSKTVMVSPVLEAINHGFLKVDQQRNVSLNSVRS